MPIDRRKLMALVAAGAVWVIGIGAITLLLDARLLALGLIFVVGVSTALASERTTTAPALVAAWVVASAVSAVAMVDASGSVGFGIVLGGTYASVFIVGWIATAFFLLLAMDPARRRVLPRSTHSDRR